MNGRFISEKNLHLASVPREENRKSLRNAAHIWKSILEVPGIFKMFCHETLKNFDMVAENQWSFRRRKK